jgi:hypothetical protein
LESPTLGVKFKTPTARLSSLAPGESVIVPVTFSNTSAPEIKARGLELRVIGALTTMLPDVTLPMRNVAAVTLSSSA